MVKDLRAIAGERARLDDRELELIDRARRQGATWADVAAALGLGSRQAAEQRRQRLAVTSLARRRERDIAYGLTDLRDAVIGLGQAVERDARWDERFVRAGLVRETVAAAATAEPGPLFALAAQAVTDLTGAPVLPSPVRTAVLAVRRALRSAVPVSTDS